MKQYIALRGEGLEKIRECNPALISYNIEMTEVTGGTFWRAYTDAQIDGTENVPPPDFSKGLAAMHQWYDPIDTTNPRLLKLARELGSCWIRVSGTWATRTYYDFDNEYPDGTAPAKCCSTESRLNSERTTVFPPLKALRLREK